MNKINLKNKWALICESTSIDSGTNLISLFKTIDEITITPPQTPLPKLPSDGVVIPLPHQLVAVWAREGNLSEELKVKARILLRDSSEIPLLEQEIEMFFEKGKSYLRSIVSLNALKFKSAGDYRYEIEPIDEKVKGQKAIAEFSLKIKS